MDPTATQTNNEVCKYMIQFDLSSTILDNQTLIVIRHLSFLKVSIEKEFSMNCKLVTANLT